MAQEVNTAFKMSLHMMVKINKVSHTKHAYTVHTDKATYVTIFVDTALELSLHRTGPWNKISSLQDFEEIR